MNNLNLEINKDTKIVFFDIDGTIYNFKTGIPESTITAIHLLKQNGHIPVICTGRTRAMIYQEFIDVGFNYIIAGAGTYVEHNGEVLFYKRLDNQKAVEIINAMWKYEFTPIPEGKDYIYVGEDREDYTDDTREVIETYRKNLGDKCRKIDLENIEVSKVSGIFTKKSNPQGLIEEFGEQYNIVNHNNHLIEFIPEGFSKAKGIEFLINNLGISIDNTYAFGDSFNDLEMLQYVKYGVAMGNSHPEIKKLTNYLTTDFDKDGILNGLKQFGLI